MHNNNSEDRGMLKWQPFYSVLPESEIRKTYNTNNIDEKPELSEDQIEELENLIVEAYNSGNIVELTIYDKYKKIYIQGKITKLDSIHKAIFLDKKMIPFKDILKIKFIV